MIRIDRQRTDANGDPIQPRASWMNAATTKTTEAIADGPGHEVTDFYRDDRLKVALEELFHDKCAYCESKGFAGFPWDVEHFRPKGAVAEDDTHTGYYWLAYTWTNLYPSCVFCNQSRRDKPTFDDPDTGASAGKKDQFPVDPESSRARAPGDDIDVEARLLLDPCQDPPQQHIGFNALGEAVALNESELGSTSIGVFNLNRKRVRDARHDHLGTLQELIDEQVDAGMNSEATRGAVLRVMGRANKPYAGLVRSVEADPAAFGF